MPVSCIAVASSFATIKVGPWPYRSNKLGPPSSTGTRTSKECRKNDAMDSSVDSSRSPTRFPSSTPYFSILAKSFVLSASISRTISSINRHLGIGSRTMCSADGAGLSVAGVRRFFAPTPTPSPKPAGAGVLRRTYTRRLACSKIVCALSVNIHMLIDPSVMRSVSRYRKNVTASYLSRKFARFRSVRKSQTTCLSRLDTTFHTGSSCR